LPKLAERLKIGLVRTRWGAALIAVAGLAGAALLLGDCYSPSPDPGNVTPAGVVSCALRQHGSTTLFCVETLGYTVNQASGDQTACEQEPADSGTWTFAYDACPRQGALGGCSNTTDVTQVIEVTQWYYAGGLYLRPASDAGDAGPGMARCVGDNNFVDP
jgi:hypothetical protein